MASYKWLVVLLLTCPSMLCAQDWVSLYNNAQQAYNEGNYETSLSTAKECLSNYQGADGSLNSNYESILRLLTNICFTVGNYEEGLEYADKEIRVKEQTGNLNNLEHAYALYNRGSIYQYLNQYEKALEDFVLTAEIFGQFFSNTEAEVIECQWKIAGCQYELGQVTMAYALYEQTFPDYSTDQGINENYISAAFIYANLLIDNGRYEDALFYTDNLLQIYEQLDNSEYDRSLLLTNKGLCLHRLNQLEQAESAYAQAATLFEQLGDNASNEYLSLVNLRAVNLEKLGESGKAKELLAIVGEQGNSSNRAIALSNEGNLLLQNGDFEGAELKFNEALSLIDPAKDPDNHLLATLDLVDLYIQTDRVSDAITKLANYPEAGEYPAKYYYIVGNLRSLQAQWPEAKAQYTKAYELLKASNKSGVLYQNVISSLGVVEQENGNYLRAEALFNEHLDLLRSASKTTTASYAVALNNLGTVNQNQADYLAAKMHFEESQTILKNLGADSGSSYAGIIENLGLTLTQLGEYSEAEKLISQSLEIKKSEFGQSHPAYATTLQSLGRIKQFKGKYQEAEPLFSQALEIKKATLGTNHPLYASALNSSALLYQTMGNFNRAEPLFRESASIYKDLFGAFHPDYATALENIATLLKLKGNNTESLKLLEEALAIDEKVYGKSHPRYATTLHNLASIYKDINQLDKSKKLYEEALAIDKAVYGENHPDYASTLYNLAVLNQQLHNYTEAEGLFVKALELRKNFLGENHPDYAYSVYGLAGLYHATQEFEKAKPYYDEVIKNYLIQIDDFFPSLSESEKSAFYAKIRPVIESYQDYAVEYATQQLPGTEQQIGELYDLQLKTKALLLHSSNKVRNRIFASGNQELINQYLSWTEQKEKLSKYLAYSDEQLAEQNISLVTISNEINDLEKELSQQSELFASDVEEKKYSWKEVQQALEENQAALEIIRIKKRYIKDSILYVALIVKKGLSAPKMVILNDGEQLENRYFNYYRNSIKYAVGDDISFQEFWKPIDQELAGLEQVFASTDGIFNKININTLWDTEDSEYVLDEYIVRNISNTKEILNPHSRVVEGSNTAEVFGFPDFNLEVEEEIDHSMARTRASEFGFADEIPELPGTKTEVDLLNGMLEESAWKSNLYLRENASEPALKKIAPPKLLHIATHGFFKSDVVFDQDVTDNDEFNQAEQNPLFRSGLLFAGSAQTQQATSNFNEEDGVLTAYEAMNLNLDGTELVVLSACETGIGEVKNGEGVYGLQRSFMVAGAKSVIMSLWQVDDNTTQQLMTNFYRNWLSGKDKFESFKNAQLELKEEYADPFHWGAFIIIGTD